MTDRQIQWPDVPLRLRKPKPLNSDILTCPSGVTVNERAWYQRVRNYDKNTEKIEVRGDPRPKPVPTGNFRDDAMSMCWYDFQEKHCPNVWTYRPAEERAYVSYVRSSYRRMEESREREGRVTLANWKRLQKLHFIIRMLGKDGTFAVLSTKKSTKSYLPRLGLKSLGFWEKPGRRNRRR